MRNQYTCRKLMIRLLIILIILNLNLFRLEPVSVSQSVGPLISLERISAFREVMAQAGGEEQLELPALPPATGQVFFSSQDYEPVSQPRPSNRSPYPLK